MAYHGTYETPEEILHDESLDRSQRIRLLEQWRDDKSAYLRASGEGMGGEVEADLLKRIKKALAALREGTGPA
ncbi:hypothetical protein E2L08_15180 [Palleronia sediminis]|uniref:Uncharacterized protein n=1 Tax=Palleronia sediminis TaxID=2547833 RepID=A0A4R5ZYB8_9RHOB|nr:hypothetical protein [Palleronia sediminis]TDL75254.1 hypothetical protein E2L08_15180 [Palleronia sediminis]